ncbi:MAG: RHS repeat-associated core domain-containing protein, partial [Bacteroidales bacterium]|nr:RHS repeat-associated core domain-containing protein [Bacteroidales bacterium]
LPSKSFMISFARTYYPLVSCWTYTFSAKEKDVETGLSYFGSRYYSSDLSIWLSVDPMSDKYASLSPYVYCADNPIKLVDPNGEEVIIVGDQVDNAFRSLQSGTNLQLSIDKDGKITATGKALNENDKQLLSAIESPDVTCKINTGSQFRAGEYKGTTYDAQSETAISTNNVNIYSMQGLEKTGASGSGIIHEITEGYNLGRYVVDTRKSTIPSNASEGHMETKIIGAGQYEKEYNVFVPTNTELYNIFQQEGHLKATKAPNEMTRKESQSYKASTFLP